MNSILNGAVTLCLLLLFGFSNAEAQGPPILGDKPIMLGAKRKILKSLTEIRKLDSGTYVKAPLMFHYIPTANTFLAVHIPMTHINKKDGFKHTGLGDIDIIGKYQFYRKDGTAKTLRMVIKSLNTIPTGQKLNVSNVHSGYFQSYLGTVIGYESIGYGLGFETGYNWSSHDDNIEWRQKCGAGLPLLKASYPAKQLNLYFEYSSTWKVKKNAYQLLYGQGIQYAIGQVTLDLSVQVPLYQYNILDRHHYSLFFGGRFVF